MKNIDHEEIPEDFFHKLVFKEKMKEFMKFEETIYFSLLDLEFHKLKSTELTAENLIKINSELLEESFGFNFSVPRPGFKEIKS